jgi:hypothetical protein
MRVDVGVSDVGVADAVGLDEAVVGSDVVRSAPGAGVEVQAAPVRSSVTATTRNRGRGGASAATRAR